MIQRLHHITLLGIALLFMALPFQKAQGTHLMGSDISWECVGKDSFEVTLAVYRDCQGISLDKPSLNFSCAPNSIKQLNYTDGEDITPVCDEACTQCETSGCKYDYGFEKHSVTWLVDFSGSGCSEVTFSYSENARNSAITTGPSGSLYTEAWMNMDKAPCNNSPQFDADPTPMYCKDQQVYYSQGISSNDKDSLGNLLDSTTFEWTEPLTGPDTKVSWSGNFAYDDPITWKGKGQVPKSTPMPYGLHLDNTTGDLQFTPTKAGQITVMAFEVSEYRNGEEVARTRRDLQITIEDCPNNQAPTLTGYNCNNEFFKEVCEGESASFNFCTNDPDNPSKEDTVTISFRPQNLPEGYTWTDNNGEARHPTGTLSWTPKVGDASDEPYTFSLQAIDDHCPVSGRTSRTFNIKVNPQPEAIYSTDYLKCGKYDFSAQATRGKAVSFQWTGAGGLFSNLRNMTHRYPKPGKYPYNLQLSANDCDNDYKDTIILDEFLHVDIGNDSSICYGDDIELGGQAADNNGAVTYTWHDSVTGKQNRTFKNLTKDTTIWLKVEDSSCSFTDTVKVKIRELPKVDLGMDRRICADDTLTVDPVVRSDMSNSVQPPWLYLSGGNQAPQYNWHMEGSNTTLSDTSFFNFSDSGTYVLGVADTFGCSSSDTIKVHTNPALEAEAFPKEICRGEKSDLKATVTGGPNAEYMWVNLNTPDTLYGRQISVSPSQTTDYRLYVTEVKGSVLCKDSAELTLAVHGLPNPFITNLPGQCSNADTLGLSRYGVPQPDPADPVEGSSWRIHNNQQALNKDILDPQKLNAGSYNLTYRYTDSNECVDSSTASIDIHPLPNLNAGNDTVICMHHGNLVLTPNRTNPNAYWDGEGSSAIERTSASSWEFNPEHNDVSTGGNYNLVYHFTENGGNRCSNSDTVSVTIQRSPDINISDAEMCIDDNEIDLPKDPVNGSWSGDHIEGDQTFVNPGNTGQYEVKFTARTEIQRTCEITEPATVTVHELPDVEAQTLSGETKFCSKTERVVLNGTPPSGPDAGGPTGVGSWQGKAVSRDGDQFYFNPSIAGPTEDGDGYELTYTFNDTTTGCSNSASVNVEVDPQPMATIANQANLYCIGRPYSVSATYSNVDRIEWTTNADDPERGFSNSTMKDGKASVSYRPNETQRDNDEFEIRLTGYGSDICEPVRDTITVDISAQPQADFEAVKEGCSPFTTQFENRSTIVERGEIAQYQWRFGDGNTSLKAEPKHTFNQHGEYDVTLFAVSDGGCVDTMKKWNYITVNPTPVARFRANPTFTTIQTPRINFENNTRYADDNAPFFWNFGDHTLPDGGTSTETNPTHQYSDTGSYTISMNVENRYGCKDTIVRENYVVIEPAVLNYAPNAFTPNNDGNNDVYRVEASNFTEFRLTIFNRWGEKLYSSNEYESHGWDGTYNGEDVPTGTYMYTIELVGIDGGEYSFSGSINLLR